MARKLITFITPKAGKWIITTRFDKEVEATLYDPTSTKPERNPPSLIILGWPYGRGKIKLRWTEFVADAETAKTATLPNGKKKYLSHKTFFDSNLVIGTREEEVDYLNQIETHPAVVEITAADGGTVEMVIMIAFEILDPILTRKLEDFLGYATGFVIEAFRLWAATKNFKDLRAVDTKDNPAIPHEIDDKIKVLNTNDFIPKGFCIPRVAVIAIPIAERSKDLLEAEENVAKQLNNALAAVHKKEIELQQNEAQEVRNTTEIKFRKEDAAIKIDLVTKSSEGLAKVNKGWGEGGLERLYIGGGQSNSMQNLVESHLQVQDFADSDSDTRRHPLKHNKKGDENV